MTESAPTEKVDPETLVLRGRPRKVVRFKRNILIGAAAVGCVAIVGVTWLGLRGSIPKLHEQKELYDPDKGTDAQKAKLDQLQALPKSYAELPAKVPQLGPPLPGDLGGPILEHQKAQIAMAGTPGAANATGPAIHEAGLFFQVTSRGVPNIPTGNEPPASVSAGVPEGGKSGLNLNPDTDQNGQGHKLDFVTAKPVTSIYNGQVLQMPASPYEVMAGTIISASLITGLNSDLPGTLIAQVTAPVFDTVTGKILLIPQGTRVIGEYDSVVAFGQSRALVVWKRLIMPDGSSLEIDNLPATDTAGYVGLSDTVDYHTWSLIKGIGLSTLLGISAQGSGTDDSDLVKAMRASVQQTANQAGQKIVDKTLNVQPTLTIRPGWSLRIIVHKDLILKPYGK